MKTTVLIIFSIIISSAYSQEYIELLDINNSWTIEMEDNISVPPELNQFTYSYLGDSTIENLDYKIFGGALLREDTTNRKVYLKKENSNECLLFDFNAKMGDNIEVCDFEIIIDSISTIELINGEKRKIFYHTGTITGNYYIEGVGSDHGFIHLSEAIGPASISLMCFKNGNEELLGTRCGEVSIQRKSVIRNNNLTFSPNPAIDFININSPENIKNVSLFNLTGRKEYEKNIENQKLDLSNIKSGYYIIEFIGTNGNLIKRLPLIIKK